MTAHGASREALAAARERLDALTDNTSVDAAQLADELAAVTALLDREVSLRRVLTDPAQAGEAKAELAGAPARRPGRRHDRRPGGRHGALPLVAVARPGGRRWRSWPTPPTSPPRSRPGALDDVEDELFRFGRIVASNTELRAALTDRNATARGQERAAAQPARRPGQRRPPSVWSTRLVTAPRGRSLEAGLESLSKLAAEPPGPHGRRRHLGGAAERRAEAAPRRRPGEALRPARCT